MSITVKNLTKVFGQQKAIDDISFEVRKGEILGFLGPNGAGKSTTMKISTGYLPPTHGSVEVCGYDVTEQSVEVRRHIGYLPEHNPLYHEMYVREYLYFIGRLHRLSKQKLKQRMEEIITLCGLTLEQNKKIEALSKGYRQRVGLAQALIHDPQVLILDEPTTGLDPNQIVEIRKLIRNISENKTVIFSTHIMQEVQALCDKVVVIDKGRIVANDAIDQLKVTQQKVTIINAEFDGEVDMESIQRIQGVLAIKHVKGYHYRIQAPVGTDIRSAIFNYATENKVVLLGLQQEEASIENVFRDLTSGKEGGRE